VAVIIGLPLARLQGQRLEYEAASRNLG
jgi:hypothetical protein